jgi:hypothetical protein
MSKIYKYLKSEHFDLVFLHPHQIALKASTPKEFNDPFELFLGMDTTDVREEILAYYQELVSQIQQSPTVCFSKAPDIIPMWAHYAQESSGFVLEIEEESLAVDQDNLTIEDVHYSSEPVTFEASEVGQAYGTGKPRHNYFIMRKAFSAAYFTKRICWSYEKERRLVIQGDNLICRGGHVLYGIPRSCVTGIIAGANAKADLTQKILNISAAWMLPALNIRIGRGSAKPYFVDPQGIPYQFDGQSLIPAVSSCPQCKEPLSGSSNKLCHWCSMDEMTRQMASIRNPVRTLSRLGLFDDYAAGIEKIISRTNDA